MEGWRPLKRAALAFLVLGGLVSAQVRAPRGGAPANGGSVAVPEPSSDNVLILMADDLGIDMVGVYGLGSDPAPTPNIDQLAATGVLFRNAWSQPTCSPTRATIQTGRYGFRTSIGQVIPTMGGGPALPLDELTLPEMLDLGTGARYAHAAIGKWHLGTSQVGGDLAPNLAGYSHFAGSLDGQIHAYDFWTRVVDGAATPGVTGYNTSVNVDDALDWIGEQTKPWLCFVSFQAPHAPFHRPPSNLHTQSLPPGEPRSSCTDQTGIDPYPFYKAMVETMDTEIGRLLDGIPPAVLERTTVIFLSDNGGVHCFSPDTNKAKGTLYEGGVHVPFIVAGSKVRNTGVCEALVNACDVFATVADIAGVDLADAFPGVTFDSVSVLPYLLLPGRPSIRETAFAETFSPNGAGNPVPLPVCPDRVVCQPNFGFDGPGFAALSVCGDPLYGIYGANLVPVSIINAPPNANATLRIGSYSPAFNVQYGATMISSLPSATLPFTTDSEGKVTTTLWTAALPDDVHYQAVVDGAPTPTGYTVSNAVRIDLLWTDMLAVRNQRYKLIRLDPCNEELYDLAQDPAELTNLLLQPLDAEALAAYDSLALALDTLR